MSENKSLPVLGTFKQFLQLKKSSLIIDNIEFVDTIPSLNDVQNKWDVSDAQNGSIMAWLDNNTLKISGNGVVLANKNCLNLFSSFKNVKRIEFNDLFDTSEMILGTGVFNGCEKLKEVNISNWNTKKLEQAVGMFANCYELETLDLSRWNTQNLQDASWMFKECSNIKSVNMSMWNTKQLDGIFLMFEKCRNLKHVDLSEWNIKKTRSRYKMFKDCYKLEQVITKDKQIIKEVGNDSIVDFPKY